MLGPNLTILTYVSWTYPWCCDSRNSFLCY